MIVTFYFNFSNGFQLVLKISCLENSVELDRLSLFLKCKIETTSPRDIAIGQEDLSGYPAGQLRFFLFFVIAHFDRRRVKFQSFAQHFFK